jgi:hypothetical protein
MKTLARHHDQARILARFRGLSPDARRQWGRMSAHQMVCHLSDSLLMAIGERATTSASGLFRRTLLKWIVLYVPVRWPTGVETSPELDQERGGTPPVEFASDVVRVEALVGHLVAQAASFPWPPHPLFGPMSRAAWLRWGYLHLDHHLRQFGR